MIFKTNDINTKNIKFVGKYIKVEKFFIDIKTQLKTHINIIYSECLLIFKYG